MVQFSYYPYCGGEGWELEEFRRLAANLMADSRRHPLPKSHAMAENHLRILHLSDLHERVALPWMSDERKAKVRLGAAGRFRVLGAGFLKILREIRQAGPLHAVCFSGDAADWGLPEEYARVTRRLDEILAAVGVPRDRLFLIPGNHDVQRKTSEPAWKGMRRLIGDQRHSLSQWMAGSGRPNRVPQSWRDEILARTAAYHQWVQGDLARPDLHPSQCPHGRLGYRVTVSDLGFPFPVHVIGLDSAWLCGDDNDAGKLLLTQAQVGLNTTDKEGRPFPGFRLAMVHHPLADIADGADSRRCLAGTVDLLLHGHQHDPIAEEQADPDRTLRVIAAGSLYEGDEGDRWLNSFHVIDVLLNDDGRPLCYDVEFWGWSSRGHWHRTGAIYQAARDGRLRWWTPLGEEWRRKQPVPLVNVERERVFVGREAELADLEQALLPAAGAPRAVVVCSVQGMAGVGKTWLVEHFYADHMEAFPGGLLRLVLDPTVPASPQDLFGRLADALKMPAGDRNALAEELRRQRLLIHMENVDDRPLAAVAATMAAQLTGVPLAITGRYQGFAGGPHWRTVPLSSFDPPTAADQLAAELTSESAGRIPVADRGRLAGALGGLPLGIHLAAGYLNAGFAVDAFLDYLRQRGLSLEPFAPNDGNYRERTHVALAATLDLSLELLERSLDGDVSVKLAALCYLGLAPRAGFGLGLATAITGLDETATTVLLAQAHSLSLVERVPSDERPDNAWRVHALLAERFRARLADDDRDAAASRMRAWFLEHLAAGDIDTQGQRWADVEQEILGLSEWLAGLAIPDARVAANAGYDFARAHGPYHLWITVAQRGMEEEPEDEWRSRLLWVLGNLAWRAGEPGQTLALAEEKETFERERGEDREASLAARLKADVLAARGELVEALCTLRADALPAFERLGDVRERAVTLGQIAAVLAERGELDEALRILREEQLPVYERLGDGQSLLVSRANLAVNLLQRNAPGDREEARSLLEMALDTARWLKLPRETEQIERILTGMDAPP